ncbi:hypothetical protein N7520_004982 [Penicillium odoratum]|uniref:uncharacterized protein n=1 Tax=Penicillium odoratum TaxID=1167516 RepID=UPI0025475DE2|nr:uncharacterized protein N7520_004982 [Penicillium odoratum]KAJ5765423.1 hypothetical protein N7520_004982 [Penicillium odoratum]
MVNRPTKEGPMACPKDYMHEYAGELAKLRKGCIKLLKNHELNTPNTHWMGGDNAPEKPDLNEDKALLPLATEVTIVNRKPDFPPPFVRLSDELVYLATKFLSSTERGRNYPYDFLPGGDIDPDRVPSGVGPLDWAHGLPFFPVYKGYYILCGRANAHWIGWILHEKCQAVMRKYPIWTIGPVVAPGSAVALHRSVDRQLHTHMIASAKECVRNLEKHPKARDVVSRAHDEGSIVPKDIHEGVMITAIYNVQGYSIHVGPTGPVGGAPVTMTKDWFAKFVGHNFDYDAASRVNFANEKSPRVYGGVHDDHDEEEEEVDGNSTDGTDETDVMDETADSQIVAPEDWTMNCDVEGETEITEPVKEEIAPIENLHVAEPKQTSNAETFHVAQPETARVIEAPEIAMSEEVFCAKSIDTTDPEDMNINETPAKPEEASRAESIDADPKDVNVNETFVNIEDKGQEKDSDGDKDVQNAERLALFRDLNDKEALDSNQDAQAHPSGN